MNTIGSPTDPTQQQNWATGYVIPLVDAGKDIAVALINAKNQNNTNTNTNGNNSNGQVIYVPSNTGTTTTEKPDNTMTYLLLAVAGIGLFATLNNDNKKRK
jgi:hypothetical protein